MITVKKQHLEYLARFASTKDAPYKLQGVYFDKDNNTLVATDGRCLGYIEHAWEGELKESKIVKVTKAALQLLKSSFKNFEYLNMEVTDKGMMLYDGEQQVLMPFIYAVYPYWRNLTKFERGSISYFGINPKLLKDFQIKRPVVIVPQSDNTSAMAVLVEEIPEFRGLIMPVVLSTEMKGIVETI